LVKTSKKSVKGNKDSKLRFAPLDEVAPRPILKRLILKPTVQVNARQKSPAINLKDDHL
jgi:hypothetical protein